MITAGEKQDLIDWITNLENQSLLQHLMELKAANESNETIFQVSEQEREAIEIAMKSIDQGKGIPHDEVMKNMKTKYPKLFND
jgi:hypothetical protein